MRVSRPWLIIGGSIRAEVPCAERSKEKSSMNILGIETSCDETSAAVLRGDFAIASSVVLSQDEIHAPYGGVVPELASRQHILSISYVVEESLRRAELELRDIDAYSVTQGPGLIGSLLVGLSYAKALGFAFRKPVIPVDHLEAHVYSAFLENRRIRFPVLALLVSGGHTSLLWMERELRYEPIGHTRDDAAGEALDKIAKFLGLGYPGGPIIDKLAADGDPRTFRLAPPQMSDGSPDFSFSGFKTAALRQIREWNLTRGHPGIQDFLAGFESSVVRALLHNVDRAVRERSPESLILCGGVARNRRLRREFEAYGRNAGIPAYIPSPEFCTDNAAMVAGLALARRESGETSASELTLNAYARRSRG